MNSCTGVVNRKIIPSRVLGHGTAAVMAGFMMNVYVRLLFECAAATTVFCTSFSSALNILHYSSTAMRPHHHMCRSIGVLLMACYHSLPLLRAQATGNRCCLSLIVPSHPIFIHLQFSTLLSLSLFMASSSSSFLGRTKT